MNNEPPVVPLTPALAALMGEPGTRKIRGLVVYFDTIEEAQQWVLDVIEASTCLKELEILSDALAHEDPDEQVRTALARLDPLVVEHAQIPGDRRALAPGRDANTHYLHPPH